ncbi:hypothetical protein CLV70_10333 [Pseudosporangium ferrugineum]|uniref:Uncharacterized protein n=1 Tax=Pseudosporangium ferrugineum TaxID=439699 RepID=A0A2T0SCI8_9ACTN|nr:hypothetical protein CLV70_10333 [Pseudosporangium ferrugineum]
MIVPAYLRSATSATYSADGSRRRRHRGTPTSAMRTIGGRSAGAAHGEASVREEVARHQAPGSATPVGMRDLFAAVAVPRGEGRVGRGVRPVPVEPDDLHVLVPAGSGPGPGEQHRDAAARPVAPLPGLDTPRRADGRDLTGLTGYGRTPTRTARAGTTGRRTAHSCGITPAAHAADTGRTGYTLTTATQARATSRRTAHRCETTPAAHPADTGHSHPSHRLTPTTHTRTRATSRRTAHRCGTTPAANPADTGRSDGASHEHGSTARAGHTGHTGRSNGVGRGHGSPARAGETGRGNGVGCVLGFVVRVGGIGRRGGNHGQVPDARAGFGCGAGAVGEPVAGSERRRRRPRGGVVGGRPGQPRMTRQ